MKSGLSQAGYWGKTTARPTQNVNIVAQEMPTNSGVFILGPALRAMVRNILKSIKDNQW